MVFGLSLHTYTLIHVIISLVAILLGLIVLAGMLKAKRLERLTWYFLVTTALTSITGFGFPDQLFPSQLVATLSLAVLATAMISRYVMHMAGPWRAAYVITATIALYLNCFVLVVQTFLKVPTLHTLAPKGNEPPFAIAQGVVLLLFVILGIRAVKSFHPDQTSIARTA